MPDKGFRLSEAEKQFVVRKIAEKRGGEPLQCYVCHTSHWQLEDYIVTPTPTGVYYRLDNTPISYPEVMLTCTNCGHRLLFDPVVLGLLRSDGKDITDGD